MAERDFARSEPELAGRRATVMGLGLFGGGVGAARFLIEAGARVTVTDKRSREQLAPSLAALEGLAYRGVFGHHDRADFEDCDLVVANPAVPPGAELLELARRSGARVTSEIGLFLERSPASWIAVTGTQGKSSTATFAATLAAATLARVIQAGVIQGAEREAPSAPRVVLGGNIGGSLLARLPGREVPDGLTSEDRVVLELSSYQLELLRRETLRPARSPAAVAITNVSADHLDRHGSIEAYLDLKRSIAELGDRRSAVIVPAGDARLAEHDYGGRPLLRVSTDSAAELTVRGTTFQLRSEPLGRVDELRVPGSFQQLNVLFALGLVCAAGWSRPGDPRLAAAIGELRAPEHRLQDLGQRRGHRVWDNAVATTPLATLVALRSLPGACVCLLGGRDKGLDWAPLALELAARRARAVVFGADRAGIAERLASAGVPCTLTEDVPSAVRAAWAQLGPSEPLLFSPGCASFDAYRNFAERAAAFRAALDDVSE